MPRSPRAGPYAALTRADFDACLDFVATGGYALRAYDRWQRLMQTDGQWHLRDPRAAAVIRQNLGTIIDTETLKVRLKGRIGGTPLGEIEEGFAATLTPGDTFLIGGQVVRYEGLREMTVEVSRTPGPRPQGRGVQRHQIRHLDPADRTASWTSSSKTTGPTCPPTPPAGWPCSARCRACPNPTACWWKASRMTGANTLSSTALPGATASRRWAFC